MRPADARRRAIRLLGCAATAAGFAAPLAAQTVIDCFAPVDCRAVLQGIDLRPVMQSMPASRYKLVILASVHRTDSTDADSAGTSYAMAGVSERLRQAGTDFTVVPLQRYSASAPFAAGSGEAGEREATATAVRAAVMRLLAVCTGSPGCPVHTPYR